MVASPENVKVCCVSAVDVVAPCVEADRSNIQGTGTSLPALAVVVEPGVVEVVVPGVVVFASVPVMELSEITAKSIRPDAGLKMTSLIVPSD